MPMLPKLQLALSDVRDVAAAHIKSLNLADAPGKYVDACHVVRYVRTVRKEMAKQPDARCWAISVPS